MNYRVFWVPQAEQRLEAIVQNATDAASIATAARQIDWQLVSDPLAFGESRYETIRIGFVLPLGVQFEVMEDVRTVIVHGVWLIH
jgi:hypothetical protein